MEIRKAERKRVYFKGALIGPSGSGKTYSALRVAFGLSQKKKICLIDTENGSGELYADINMDDIGDFSYIQIEPPFTCAKYGEAIDCAIKAGMDTIIVDSLTHAWAGEGGLLEKKSAIQAKTNNGYTAWAEPTKDYNGLIAKILFCPAHILVTIRSKQDYVQEKDEQTNRTVVRKVGMGAVMRDGIEYEFTVVWDLDNKNIASSEKDRTKPTLFQGQYKKLTADDGKALYKWLMSGKAENAVKPKPPLKPIAVDQKSTQEAVESPQDTQTAEGEELATKEQINAVKALMADMNMEPLKKPVEERTASEAAALLEKLEARAKAVELSN